MADPGGGVIVQGRADGKENRTKNYALLGPGNEPKKIIAYAPNYPGSYGQTVVLVSPTPVYGYYDDFGYYDPYYEDNYRYHRNCVITTVILLIVFFIIIPGVVVGVYYGGGYNYHRPTHVYRVYHYK